MVKMYYKSLYKSPIGNLTLVCDNEENLTGAWLEGQKYFCSTIKSEMVEKDSLSIFRHTKSWLDRYFKGVAPSPFELALAPIGSDFRLRVWQILCEIPYGEVMTYGAISKIIAAERGLNSLSAQAVGGAVGHNPISIIIPCHRVIGTNNSLTGYAGGLEVKKKLLIHEGVKLKGF